ncbi:hypothetical protein ACFPOG_30635 [Paenibacillus aestuarii]|uniref:Uncharacterized protein n=1 Tax=Paenibacillus aestuarii TaxID=516965 RepID=A0ABW0KGG6_9BACL
MINQSEADRVNDIRSNIIELLMRLFKELEKRGKEIHLSHENNELHYVPGKGIWIDGCADRVAMKDYRYSSVSLGDQIRSYNQLPYHWLKRLVDGGDLG